MQLAKISIEKNPFIGLFLRASDSLVLVPRRISPSLRSKIEASLSAKAIPFSVDQCDLVGLFSCMNSSGMVLPSFAEPSEVSVAKKLGLNVLQLDSFQAIANNISCNDRGVLVNPDIPDSLANKISDCLGVPAFQSEIAGQKTVGSLVCATNKGFFASNNCSQEDLSLLEECFKAKGGSGTANMGASFVSLGLCANSKGALLGDLSTGIEVQQAFEALSGSD